MSPKLSLQHLAAPKSFDFAIAEDEKRKTYRKTKDFRRLDSTRIVIPDKHPLLPGTDRRTRFNLPCRLFSAPTQMHNTQIDRSCSADQHSQREALTTYAILRLAARFFDSVAQLVQLSLRPGKRDLGLRPCQINSRELCSSRVCLHRCTAFWNWRLCLGPFSGATHHRSRFQLLSHRNVRCRLAGSHPHWSSWALHDPSGR